MMAQKKREEAEALKKKVAESNGRIDELSEEEDKGKNQKEYDDNSKYYWLTIFTDRKR